MNDETEKSAGIGATPNRGSRREAPTIEGQAIKSSAVEDSAVQPGGAAEPTIGEKAIESEPVAAATAPDLSREPAPATATVRTGPAWPGPAALAALLLGGVALYYAFNPALPPVASPETVSALGQRLEALEARFGALESKPAPALPAPPDLGPLNGRIEAAEKTAADARAQAARAVEQARTQPT
ncbi:MAG: hypothetical protein JWN07_1393, partial [Hyphomicrobiales bacterium]|nr:hypothetical protein [Hyphomicrobiales bacterium]